MQIGQTGDRTADLQVGGRPFYPSATAAVSHSRRQPQPPSATAAVSHSRRQPQPPSATAAVSHSRRQPQPPSATATLHADPIAFFPRLFDGVEVRALCGPINYFHTKLTPAMSLLTSLCALGQSHAGTEKGIC
ncbi:unnamed protein product [Pleuronectes platessa]|uniref:Uncharacterized protein n=1 Tax=Pleuronectes platessa TaxID=8262 RepID=A0A9N7UGW4_PLEPL|nr:unnamed protein product [Pleuronectes platessa]